MLTRVLAVLRRRLLYPWSDGTARRQDPTYGKVDREVQWFVNDHLAPHSVGQRLAMELQVQRTRPRRNRWIPPRGSSTGNPGTGTQAGRYEE